MMFSSSSSAPWLVYGLGLVHLPSWLRTASFQVPSCQSTHGPHSFGEVSMFSKIVWVFILGSILHKVWFSNEELQISLKREMSRWSFKSQYSQMWWHVPALKQGDHEFEGAEAIVSERWEEGERFGLFCWTKDKSLPCLSELSWLYMWGKTFFS